MADRPPVVLASSSPRRREVLRTLSIAHDVDPPAVPEVRGAGESSEAYVRRLAIAKATAVAERHPNRIVLAGDTVVELDGSILEKPIDEDDAVRMLMEMAGRSHVVIGGMALAPPEGEVVSRVDRAEVWFRPFGMETARSYVATGEPMDKAGAYGIQGMGAALVRRIDGDYFAVMGFSVAGLVDLMSEAGHPFRFDDGPPLESAPD